jgi:hypothetical protein
MADHSAQRIDKKRLSLAGAGALLGFILLSPSDFLHLHSALPYSFVSATLLFGRGWWGAIVLALSVGGALSAFPKSVFDRSPDDWRPPATWTRSFRV